MAGSSENRNLGRNGENNRNRRRRRREQREEGDNSNSSDEENINPTPARDPRFRLQGQLREIQRQIQEAEAEYSRGSKEAEEFSGDLIQKWHDILEPETDYESEDDILSESDSDSSTFTSDSSFLTDSSDFSDDETTEGQSLAQKHRRKGTKKLKKKDALTEENYIHLQDRMNQIYTPVPDMQENQISEGLLCVTKWKDNWIRALVQSYDVTRSTVHVGALDYGVYFDVPRDDIKPILSDLSDKNSIPYRAAKEKKKPPEDTETAAKKQKLAADESIKKPEESCKDDNEKKNKDHPQTITAAEKVEKRVKDECSSDKEPIPTTSAASNKEDDKDNEGKKYKKSLLYLQFQWCKKQPDYMKLRLELMDKYAFPHTESADIFAFLDYIQKFEEKEKDEWNSKSAALKNKVQRKKEKVKAMYRKKYTAHLKKFKEKYQKKLRIMQRAHEKSIRHQYLMGTSDEVFEMKEWKEKQNKNN